MISKKGIALIRAFESFVPLEYTCVAGKRTIGYGHVIKGGEKFEAGVTVEQAEELLRQDIAIAEKAVADLVKVHLNQYQTDALVSFAFNIGRRNFAGSTLLRELNQGNYEGVPKEMKRWVYASGTIWKGLLRRRIIEGDIFKNGAGHYRPVRLYETKEKE